MAVEIPSVEPAHRPNEMELRGTGLATGSFRDWRDLDAVRLIDWRVCPGLRKWHCERFSLVYSARQRLAPEARAIGKLSAIASPRENSVR